jgi:hypothetical protein
MNAGTLIATILRHDRKVASYKIALIRSINDVVLGFPHIGPGAVSIAIPLRTLARFWVAYYWPFVDPRGPIQQGQRSAGKEDLSFRPSLTRLRQEWEKLVGSSHPSDGYFLVGEFLSEIRMKAYPEPLVEAFSQVIRTITLAIQQPIRYAGPDQYGVFPPPHRWSQIQVTVPSVTCLPETCLEDLCIVVDPELWSGFCDLSLWIEALCIHEWCLFTERLSGAERGIIYGLLTDRPDNRRPLTWERNQIDILVMEGHGFICPWTQRHIGPGTAYDIDHLVPVSLYPINEVWNLVPSDREFNQHRKRDRLPGPERLRSAEPILARTYGTYTLAESLAEALAEDVGLRFATVDLHSDMFASDVAGAAVAFIEQVAESRNWARF